jgi:hypothetical protein
MTFKNAEDITKSPWISKEEKQRMYKKLIERQR